MDKTPNLCTGGRAICGALPARGRPPATPHKTPKSNETAQEIGFASHNYCIVGSRRLDIVVPEHQRTGFYSGLVFFCGGGGGGLACTIRNTEITGE